MIPFGDISDSSAGIRVGGGVLSTLKGILKRKPNFDDVDNIDYLIQN